MIGLLIILMILMLIAFIAIAIILYNNPKYGLMPYNQMIQMLTPQKPIYSETEKINIFPEARFLEDSWQTIRNEAQEVMNIPNNNIYQNFENRSTEFWDGWTMYPLRLHNVDIEDALEKCPKTMTILKDFDNISTAAFSILAPGKKLSPHYGHFKGILRYHLGLIVPKGDCHIVVDKQPYHWKEGEGVLLDVTYLHHAVNNTELPRVILFIDVNRPMNNFLTTINQFIIKMIQISPHNRKAINSYKSSDLQLLN